MKKKRFIFVFIFFLIIICAFICANVYKYNKNKQEEKRYIEIRQNVKDAIEILIKAQMPYCPIESNVDEELYEKGFGKIYTAASLNSMGLLSKNDVLEPDGKSYCDVYGRAQVYFKDKNDQMHNCKVTYKMYLKCSKFEDKGFVKWDEWLDD
ncbi:MAG: hypothetical protein J6G98_00655 [Bacilli bacterium]|nr:hypothetical protein [Bacilli bacterium]